MKKISLFIILLIITTISSSIIGIAAERINQNATNRDYSTIVIYSQEAKHDVQVITQESCSKDESTYLKKCLDFCKDDLDCLMVCTHQISNTCSNAFEKLAECVGNENTCSYNNNILEYLDCSKPTCGKEHYAVFN